jgi:uncharacterized protein YndB with AHSA1/START domain
MTRTTRNVDATVAEVWSVLADGRSYARWVVGAKSIREVDDVWPRPGARLHHTVGVGPLTLQDNTLSLEAEAPRYLQLEARGRPLGRARITFVLAPAGAGTEVVIDEEVTSPAPLRAMDPLFAPMVRARNEETLRRLDAEVQAGRP